MKAVLLMLIVSKRLQDNNKIQKNNEMQKAMKKNIESTKYTHGDFEGTIRLWRK